MAIAITTDHPSGETLYQLPGTFGRFTMPALPESETTALAAVFFRTAVDSLGDFLDKVPAIAGDGDLSDVGRSKRLEPLQRDLVLGLASVDATLDREAAHFAKRETQLYAVPRLDPTHGAMATEDAEIRGWLRQQSPADRLKVMKRIEAEPVGNERLLIAVLRTPIPAFLDDEIMFAQSLWRQAKRAEDPSEAFAIDRGRATLAWSRRGVSHVAGLSKQVLGWEPERITRTILTSPDPAHHGGFKVFGFDAATAEAVKRAIAHESRQRQH